MSLPSFMYGDPAKVLEQKQAMEANKAKRHQNGGCAGCIHKARLFGMDYCELGNTKPGVAHMQRCGQYRPKG